MKADKYELTYDGLEVRYGGQMAYDLLLAIEKLANIQDELAKAESDNDERLQRALNRLDSIDFSKMS